MDNQEDSLSKQRAFDELVALGIGGKHWNDFVAARDEGNFDVEQENPLLTARDIEQALVEWALSHAHDGDEHFQLALDISHKKWHNVTFSPHIADEIFALATENKNS